MAASPLFHLGQLEPQFKGQSGSRARVTKSNFPALQGMSLYKLILHPKAIREPHWHANADELGYCLKGKVLISLYGNKNTQAEFLVNEGEAFLIPSGALHYIENVGEATSEIIIQFSNEEPEDFALSSTMGMFSDSVLGNTWNVSAQLFHSFKRSTQEVLIVMGEGSRKIPKEAHYPSIYRYDLKGSSPLLANEGGSAKVARGDVWPILTKQALYSLALTGAGMREPHWHPETAEMGYVEKGKGRMSILSPSGQVDTYEMSEGDLYFIPKAYPHHIENLTDSSLHILIFFDQAMPGDVGFTGSVKSYPNEVLAAALKAPKELFAQLPTYYEDLFIVKKINPLD